MTRFARTLAALVATATLAGAGALAVAADTSAPAQGTSVVQLADGVVGFEWD
jgi:hypothetical protein